MNRSLRNSTETYYTVRDKFLMNCDILKCQAKLSLLHREVNLIGAQRVSQEHCNERSQMELHGDAVLTLLYFSSSNISVALIVTEVQNVSVVKCPDVRAQKDNHKNNRTTCFFFFFFLLFHSVALKRKRFPTKQCDCICRELFLVQVVSTTGENCENVCFCDIYFLACSFAGCRSLLPIVLKLGEKLHR